MAGFVQIVAALACLVPLCHYFGIQSNRSSTVQTKMPKKDSKSKGKSKVATQRSSDESTENAAPATLVDVEVDDLQTEKDELMQALNPDLHDKFEKFLEKNRALASAGVQIAAKDELTPEDITKMLNNALAESLFAPLVDKCENPTYEQKVCEMFR